MDLTLNEHLDKVMRADLDPAYFLTDPYFLGLKPWPKQIEIFRKFYKSGKRMLIWVSGMRSGKTFMLGRCFAAYELFKLLTRDYEQILGLAPDSPLFITMVAVAEKQIQDTAFYQLRASVLNSPFFQSFRPRITTETITFRARPNVIVRALATESATAAGRTSKATCLDEVSGLKDTPGPAGLRNVFATLRNSTETFGKEGHVFVFGSISQSNNILTLYEQWKDSPDAMCLITPTWEVNPNITRESLKELELRDPLTFWRDFGCVPYASLDVYYRDQSILQFENRPNLLQMLREGLEVHGEGPYVLAGDPALKHDNFGLVLARRHGDELYIDGMLQFSPLGKGELNPIEISDFILKVVDTLSVEAVVFDTWHFTEAQERIRRKGVPVYNHIVRKPDHDRVKELLYQRKLHLLNYEPFIKEVRALVVDGNKVTHPRGGHDDICSALANAVWLLNEKQITNRPVLVEVI